MYVFFFIFVGIKLCRACMYEGNECVLINKLLEMEEKNSEHERLLYYMVY